MTTDNSESQLINQPSGSEGSPERVEQVLFDQRVIFVDRELWAETAEELWNEGFDLCVDVTAVDYLGTSARIVPAAVTVERFEVVASLVSTAERLRLRMRVQVPEDDAWVPSLFEIYPGADFAEREVFDLFGIEFRGHPDLSRIIMPEDWEGHPLRKDYDVGEIPVEFSHSPGGGRE